jgi:hypothetical protein
MYSRFVACPILVVVGLGCWAEGGNELGRIDLQVSIVVIVDSLESTVDKIKVSKIGTRPAWIRVIVNNRREGKG